MALKKSLALLSISLLTTAQRVVNSTFFQPCVENDNEIIASNFFASIYDNGTINFKLNATSSYSANTTLVLRVVDQQDILYESPVIDPCGYGYGTGLVEFCPLSAGNVSIHTNISVPANESLPESFFTSQNGFDEVELHVYSDAREDCVKASLYSTLRGGNATNDTQSGGMNDTGATNSSGGDGGSGASSTAYLNWTLLMSAAAVIALSSSL